MKRKENRSDGNRSYLVPLRANRQPVRRSKGHSFRDGITTANATVVSLQMYNDITTQE